MSWFQSAVNTVREVTKAINKMTGPTFDPRCGALPFNDGIGGIRYNKSSASGSAQNESEDENDNEGYNSSGEGTSQSASATRITTRARITYELDRFRKNAMLMFVQILSDPPGGCRIIELTNQDVTELVKTFTSFRFEVDVHTDLTCSQLDQKCQEFFQRDFRQYGAVVVMVLSFDGTNGQLSALDGRFSESIILRHLTDYLNPTLHAKPKIYITEVDFAYLFLVILKVVIENTVSMVLKPETSRFSALRI
ncbi:uncharacterized protein [Choristoneura fumiferana]|uniref:uncharacterized protein n=1 Tax=Choristoneura fumiferana TaxID=7141 RepID=UPI003D155125